MAAKASDKYLVSAQLMQLVEKLRCVQGFSITEEVPDEKGGVVFKMTHDMSFNSWGENITVNIYPYNEQQTVVDILSKCSMPTQLFDMGQNKKNVKDILGYLLYGLTVQQMK